MLTSLRVPSRLRSVERVYPCLSESDELAGNASLLPMKGTVISLRDSGHNTTTKWQLLYILFFSFFEKDNSKGAA